MNQRFILAAGMLLMAAGSLLAGDYTRYVNPFIGTGAIDGGLCGNNYPGATAPFGMVQLSPDTHPQPDWYNASGYSYTDSVIYGFSHTRLSGTGACDLIDITLVPTTTGSVTAHRFSHSDETARPGYYSVRFPEDGIFAELTATPRVGIHRYSYPAKAHRKVVFDLDHSMRKGSWDCKIINAQIKKVAPNAIEGYRVITGWAKLRKIYFYIEFSEPMESIVLKDDGNVRGSGTVINGRTLMADIEFPASSSPIVAKVGLSNVSTANARANMAAEASGWDFDRFVSDADAAWDARLGKIQAEGDTERLTTFYTALYHTMIQPNVFSDVNGDYTAADYTVRNTGGGRDMYTTFSLWDTYRGAHPLYSIVEPRVNAEFVNSMLDWFDVYGYLPIWQLWGNDNYCMIGNHSIPVVVDAVLKGTPGIDAERAFRAVRESSLVSHINSPFEVWESHGYMPEDIQTQSVSITLEQSFDDWCVAQLAKRLGHDEDYARFMKRSGYYANLFDPSTGFFRGRLADGKWIEPFDPLVFGANGGYPYTEGNAWQYYWYVPHDVCDLVRLTGGKKEFEKKLDTFFSLTESSGERNHNSSGMIGQYAHGNEPSHHVAYLYNDAGNPAKGQKIIHRIMTELYNNTSSGYAGNDDCGEMSAWYVLSAMGFYPVNPASGEYYIGTPLFDKCTINLDGGRKFVITASRNNPDDYKVRSVTLNGRRLSDLRLRHDDIVKGGNLHFKL